MGNGRHRGSSCVDLASSVAVLPTVSFVVPFCGLTNFFKKFRNLKGNPKKELHWRLQVESKANWICLLPPSLPWLSLIVLCFQSASADRETVGPLDLERSVSVLDARTNCGDNVEI